MTATELVRRIKYTNTGSEHQDVRLVEEFVKARVSQRLKDRMDLLKILLEEPITSKCHQRIQELLHDFSA